MMNYWDNVAESGGFDIDGIHVPRGTCSGLRSYDCEKEEIGYHPNRVLVNLYARLGLHRYNISKGTNFVLHHLKKYNMTPNHLSFYYITLVASDPATSTLVTFQVGVSEQEFGNLNVMCFVARPQSDRPHGKEIARPFAPSGFNSGVGHSWSSDLGRFYQLNESELRDNDGWIRLYLELALHGNDRNIPPRYVSRVQILSVAVEPLDSFEATHPFLQAKNANAYITFQGLPVARVGEDGEHVVRKLIVTWLIDEHTGYLNLSGRFGFFVGEDTTQRSMTCFPSAEDFKAEEANFPPRKVKLHLFDWGKKERISPEVLAREAELNKPMTYEEVADLKRRWNLV